MKNKLNILMLGSYPIINPLHGGQRRSNAFFEYYKSKNFNVTYCGIYRARSYSEYGSNDIPLDEEFINFNINKINKVFSKYDDILCPKIVHFNDQKMKKLITMIDLSDIIQFEQPYIYISLNKYLRNKSIIYSSQNIEHNTKDNNLSIKNYLDKLEINLLQRANGKIIACSKNDLDWYTKKYKFPIKYVVIKNSTSIKIALKKDKNRLKNYLSANSIKKYALFVSSYHLPNIKGFIELVSLRLGYLSLGDYIIVAGKGAALIKKIIEDSDNLLDKTALNKIFFFETINDSELQALIEDCEIILLPILYGGGTNLKTAEALLNNKKIIATDFAFRGYENFKDNKNINIANSKKEFIASMVKLLNSTNETNNENINKQLTWEYEFNSHNDSLIKLLKSE